MLSAIQGEKFFTECYGPLGEVMDLLVLMNSAANFLLYCAMSTQFRATIGKILGIQQKTFSKNKVSTAPKRLEVGE